MTNEEAIKVLQYLIPTPKRGDARSTENMKISIALLMAIKALSAEKTAECDNNHDCEHCDWTECPLEVEKESKEEYSGKTTINHKCNNL